MKTQRKTAIVGIVVMLMIASVGAVTAASQSSSAGSIVSDKSSEQPYTFEQLLRVLDNTRKPGTFVTIPMIVKTVKKNGVSFQPTPDQIEAMRKRGASEELISTIKEKAVTSETPTAAEAPKQAAKAKEGRLTVTCKPVDCLVLVDKKEVGSTKKGELPGFRLPVGTYTVSAGKENYVPDKEGQVTQITDGGSANVEFLFTLSPVALQTRGGQLFEGMVASLGGEAGLKDSRFLKAVGTLTLHSGGPQKLWPVTAFIQLPTNARFDVTKANESYIIIHTESGYNLSRSKSKKLAGAELEELEDALRRVQEYQISKIIDRLRGSGAKMTSEKLTSAPGEDEVLRVVQGADTYIVTLGAESRPKEIKLESVGLNSGLRVLLSEYNQVGSAVIPHKTQVILPGASSRGVVIQFDSVVVNPPGADFSIKKGSSGGR